jgi:hypothetical protein
MNNIRFNRVSALIFSVTFIASFNMIVTNQVLAQNTNISPGLDAKELELINRQPISPSVRANENVLGTEKRPTSFEYQENQGTRITEYTSNGRPVEIQVDSRSGTHYEMSKPINSSPTVPNTTIQRVPSIQLPF